MKKIINEKGASLILSRFFDRKKTAIFLSIFCSVLLFSSSASASGTFEYSKKILNQKDGYSRIIFDEDLFTHGKTDFSDIRVTDSKRKEVPYATYIIGGISHSNSLNEKMFNVSSSENKSFAEIEILEDGFYSHNFLQLNTSSEEFRAKIILEEKRNNEWSTIKEGHLYRYVFEKKEDNIYEIKEHLHISYPENTSKYLRITLESETIEPVTINQIHIVAQQLKMVEELETQPVQILSTTAQPGNITEILLETPQLPKTSISFTLPKQRFYRNIHLYSSNNKTNWKLLHSGTIFRGNNEYMIHDTIEFSDTIDRFFKLEIGNKNDQPIELSDFQIQTRNYYLVFPSSKEEKYTLYFGNNKAYTPEYDLKKYLTNKEISQANTVNLSPLNQHAEEVGEEQTNIFENIPILKYVLLGLGSGILVVFVFLFLGKKEE